jgi:ribonuclease Z
MKITILGCYAATPTSIKNPTSQVLEIKNHTFLIDCGEGTQVQIRKSKVKFTKINHIFISHLHGDHVFGLIGLLSTFSLLNRINSLTVFGPLGIKELIETNLRISGTHLSYELIFHELTSKESELILETDSVTVKTIPLKHRIYANGYLFKEKNTQRILNIDKIQELEIDVCYYQKIKNGGDITLENGDVAENELLTFSPIAEKSYAFCSDTVYKESIIPIIKDVDVLYHESTFLESEKALAKKTMHTTAIEAANIANAAHVKQLILGHFSARYKNIEMFKNEALTVFENVDIAEDGKTFNF